MREYCPFRHPHSYRWQLLSDSRPPCLLFISYRYVSLPLSWLDAHKYCAANASVPLFPRSRSPLAPSEDLGSTKIQFGQTITVTAWRWRLQLILVSGTTRSTVVCSKRRPDKSESRMMQLQLLLFGDINNSELVKRIAKEKITGRRRVTSNSPRSRSKTRWTRGLTSSSK